MDHTRCSRVAAILGEAPSSTLVAAPLSLWLACNTMPFSVLLLAVMVPQCAPVCQVELPLQEVSAYCRLSLCVAAIFVPFRSITGVPLILFLSVWCIVALQ